MANTEVFEGEKIISKIELDRQIEEAMKQCTDLTNERDALTKAYYDLAGGYASAKNHLFDLKESGKDIEDRVVSPTLSDKMRDFFSNLFQSPTPVTDKKTFIERRPETEEVGSYRETGQELRSSISQIHQSKITVKELMDTPLDFRGGKIAGQEKSPREESIDKIKKQIELMNEDIPTQYKKVQGLRDAAFEAWKRENPNEWAKMEKEKQAKEELTKKIALFKEFLQTKPDVDEIVVIARKNRGNELGALAKKELINRKENIVRYGLYEDTGEDNKYVEELIKDSYTGDLGVFLYSITQLSERLQELLIDRVCRASDCSCACYSNDGNGQDGHIGVLFYTRLPSKLRERFYKGQGGPKNGSSELDYMFPDLAYRDLEFPRKFKVLLKGPKIQDEKIQAAILEDLKKVADVADSDYLYIANKYNSGTKVSIANALAQKAIKESKIDTDTPLPGDLQNIDSWLVHYYYKESRSAPEWYMNLVKSSAAYQSLKDKIDSIAQRKAELKSQL